MTSSIGSRPGGSCSERKCPVARWVLLFQRDFFTIQKKGAVVPRPLFPVGQVSLIAIAICHVGAGFLKYGIGKTPHSTTSIPSLYS
jgi:hypothetical protein